MPRGTAKALVKDLNPCCMAADFTSEMAYNLIL